MLYDEDRHVGSDRHGGSGAQPGGGGLAEFVGFRSEWLAGGGWRSLYGVQIMEWLAEVVLGAVQVGSTFVRFSYGRRLITSCTGKGIIHIIVGVRAVQDNL